MLSVSINQNRDATDMQSQTNNIGLSWSQDIFRSGGIGYTIASAKTLGDANLLSVDIKEATYLKQAYTLKAQIERDRLLYKQNELSLANRDIDLFIVKAKYKAGTTDISELNRTTIERDNARTSLISIKNALRKEVYELKKIVNSEKIDSFVLPDIPLVSKDSYLSNNLELLHNNAKSENTDKLWKLTRSSYLPKLTFGGSLGYRDYEGESIGYDGNNYNYGLSLSIPLDINKKSTVQSARLQYLQTKMLSLDRKLELQQEYDLHFDTILDYKEKITVAQEMLVMYNDLYTFTDKEVQVGLKSSYDLKSLGNSLQIQKLEKEIQNYNIVIEKISLYFDTQK